ncbi:MAG: hypothetical protein RDU89_01965 [bacterium]|nr:hypothetical protein [bacterium]
MRGRSFRLDRLLRVTRTREDHYRHTAAVARRAEILARDELEAARLQQAALLETLRDAAATPEPATMTLGWEALAEAGRRLESALARLRGREQVSAAGLRDLQEAARGRKSLETLYDRHLAAWQQEQARLQAREADEHAQQARSREAR